MKSLVQKIMVWPTERKHILNISVLAAAVWFVYSGIMGHSFLINWDDGKYVINNYDVHDLNLTNIWSAFTSIYMGNYAPVQIVSYMLDYKLFGLEAAAYKLENVLFHFGSGLLFYFFLLRHSGFGRYAAFVSAVIFLSHPVQVESVAWISQRKSVLSGFFLLGALFAYGEYRIRAWGKSSWYLAALVLFAFALLSKSVAVILPLLLLLGDYTLWPAASGGKLQRFRVVPFVLLATASVLVTLYTQDPSSGGRGGISPYPGWSPWTAGLTMIPVFLKYLHMIIWPLELAPAYHVILRTSLDWVVIGGAGFLCLLLALGVVLFRYSRQLFYWWMLAFIALLPVSQIVPLVTLMNDRYLYLPMLGVAALAGGGLRFLGDVRVDAKLVAAIVVAGVLVTMCWLARQQVAVWADSKTLWTHAVRVEPESVVARVGYAATLLQLGQYEEAEPVLRGVLAEYPDHREALVNLAQLLCFKQQYQEAEALLTQVVRRSPYFSQGHELLGILYYQAGRMAEAESSFRAVVRLEKNSLQAKIALGTILLMKRELAEAQSLMLSAWRYASDRADLAYSLGCVYALQGNADVAIEFLRAAARLGLPDMAGLLARNPEFDALRSLRAFNELELSVKGRETTR